MIRTLKTTVEHHDKVTVTRETCYGDSAFIEAKAHRRAMAPTGATVTFETE